MKAVLPWMQAATFSLLVGSSGSSSTSTLRRNCSGFLVRVRHSQQLQLQQNARRSAADDRGVLSARSSYLRFRSPWTTRGGAVPTRCQGRSGGRKWVQVVQPDEVGSSARRRVRPLSTMVMGGVKGATLAARPVSITMLPTAALRGGGGRGACSGAEGAATAAAAAATASSKQRLSSTAVASVETVDDVSIIKPDRDVRSYRYLTLPNGLEVVLVNDPFTEQAAASMFIRAGHMQDPAQLAGLAHFHEHMLFLGTEKYPEEGQFENFLTQHGGSSNAYTATESTNYYFDVKSSQLRGAMDRFAQFFQTPLFAESALERELQAVDSEHSNNKNEDTWRIYQVLKATANPSHAFSKFGSGNYETLRPRPEIEFHETFYSADAMKLSVLGNEDLDTLEEWVREAFSGVRNTAPPAVPDYGPAPAFGGSELGRRVTVIPLKESRQLALSWPLPPTRVHKRSKPTIYVSHLLGYEGEGSLHKLLHERGWVSSLSAGSMITGIDFQLFRLSLSLTEEGERHTDEIIELCHRFIALLKAEPPQKRIQDDLAAMGQISFRFLENGPPSGAVQNIATTLGEDEVEPEEVLSERYTVLDWDPEAVTDVINRLTPRNCQILVVSKKYEGEASKDGSETAGWKKERWYGTSYKVEPLSEELLRKLETVPAEVEGSPDTFFLPGGNPFIPTDFGLRADDEAAAATAVAGDVTAADPDSEDAASVAAAAAEAMRSLLPASIPEVALKTVPEEDWSRLLPPSLVVEGGAVSLWHKMDRSYRVPKSSIAAKLWTPEPYASPMAAVQARMFTKLLKEDLKVWAYDASLAGLRYSLEMTTVGLQLSVGGYSSTVPLFMSKILGHISELLAEYRELGGLLEESRAEDGENVGVTLSTRQELLHQRFETARESFLRYYRNAAQDQPYETADYYVRQVMEAEVWHIDEYRRELEGEACTPAEMSRYFDKILARMHVDVMAHGNVAREEAEGLVDTIAAALGRPEPLPEAELPTRHALSLPARGEGGGNGVVVVDLEAETEEEKNSAVQVYLQAEPGESNLDLASAMEFINTLGYTSAFQQLRTREQLGYMVYTQLERGPSGKVSPPSWDGSGAGANGEGLHPGGPLAWSVVVQSSDKTPAELEERVEAWIAAFRDELAEISDEVFESTVAAMSSNALRRERSMREEASMFFGAIASRTGDFYRRYRKAVSYARLTKQAVVAAFDRFYAPGAPDRRKLTVRVASPKHARETSAAAATAGEGGGVEGEPDGPVVLRSLEEIRAFKARSSIYE